MNKRKTIIGISLILAFILLTIFFCMFKPISIRQAKENFISYEKQLKDIAKNRDLEFETTDGENNDYREYLITINEEETIRISFHIPKDEMNINNSFEISYFKINNGNFNIELLVGIVNSLSEEPITEKYINQFIKAPEAQYPPKGNIVRNDEKTVEKFDFALQGLIIYSENADNTKEIYILGETKAKYYIN